MNMAEMSGPCPCMCTYPHAFMDVYLYLVAYSIIRSSPVQPIFM